MMTERIDVEIDVVGEREVSPTDVNDGIAAANQKEPNEPLMTKGRDIDIDDVGKRRYLQLMSTTALRQPAKRNMLDL